MKTELNGKPQTTDSSDRVKLMREYVVVSGTQSVGKTTFIKALKPKLDELFDEQCLVIPEIPRFINHLYRVPINEQGTADTQYAIEKTYDTVEKLFGHMPLVADRSIVDRWAYMRANGLNLEEYYKTLAIVKTSLYTNVFYIPPEIPLENDGVRSKNPEYRAKVDQNIKDILLELDLPYCEVTGSVSKRVEIAVDFISHKIKEGV
jgi:predicted ATPase